MLITPYGGIDRIGGEHSSRIERYHTDWIHRTGRATYYGVADGCITINGGIKVMAGAVFCVCADGIEISSTVKCNIALITRFGYEGQTVYGVPVEEQGRLKYIDGCTDSILIYPPRLGDPCVNHLYFPPGVDQTFHTHPSIRLGLVLRGSGFACTPEGQVPLRAGDIFCLDVDEEHRFRTEDEAMSIIAYHPDSDHGPTDEDHPMINRTIIKAA